MVFEHVRALKQCTNFWGNLSDEERQQLKNLKLEVKNDPNLTKAQIRKKFEDFFSSLSDNKKPNPETQAKIQTFRTEFEQKMRSKLSPKAQPKIHQNMDLTLAQEREQIQQVINNVDDPSVKAELEKIKENILKRKEKMGKFTSH